MSQSGLFVSNTAQPDAAEVAATIESAQMNVNIVDCTTLVKLTQKFTVPATLPDSLIAVYKFPLIDKASVVSLEATVAGVKVVGVSADEDDMAVEGMKDDELEKVVTEKSRLEVLQLRLGSVKPGSIITIAVSFVYEIKNAVEDTDKLIFVIPQSLAPQGQPSDKKSADEKPLTIQIHVQMAGTIKKITCASALTLAKVELAATKDFYGHALKEDQRLMHANVQLHGKQAHLDRDVVVEIFSEQFDSPRAIVEYDVKSKTYCTMLTLLPKFKQSGEVAGEFIFCISRAQTMTGAKLYNAKQALVLFLKSLPDDCYFNIISFGSGWNSMSPYKSVKNDQTSIETAIAFLEYLVADTNGETDMQEMIANMHTTLKIQQGYKRQIFVIADCAPSNNVEELFATVRSNVTAGRMRIFTLCIGSRHRSFLEKLASFGGGYSHCVNQGERLEKKIVNLLKRSTTPASRNFRVQWVEGKHFVAPAESASVAPNEVNKDGKVVLKLQDHQLQQAAADPPTLSKGQRGQVYAVIKAPLKPAKTLIISAASSEGAQDYSVNVAAAQINIGENEVPMFHILAAKKLITDIADNRCYLHVGLACRVGREPAKINKNTLDAHCLRAEAVRLSKQFNMITRYSGYASTNEFGEKMDDSKFGFQLLVPGRKDVKAVEVLPTNVTPSSASISSKNSRKSVFSFMSKKTVSAKTSIPPAPGMATTSIHESGISASRHSESRGGDHSVSMSQSRVSTDDAAADVVFVPPHPNLPEEIFVNLVALQAADGHFDMTEKLSRILAAIPQPNAVVTGESAVEMETNTSVASRLFSSAKDQLSLMSISDSADPKTKDNLWATSLVLAYLDCNLISMHDAAEYVRVKAMSFCNKSVKEFGGDAQDLIDEAKKCVRV